MRGAQTQKDCQMDYTTSTLRETANNFSWHGRKKRKDAWSVRQTTCSFPYSRYVVT